MRQCGVLPMNRRTFVSLAASAASAAQPGPSLLDRYRETASRFIAAALTDDEGWRKLSYLCDRIGHRLSGSPQMMASVRWAEAGMKRDGLENVVTPKVMVPHWERGAESAWITAPVNFPLAMLGLGGSVATPPQGIEAEAVCVKTFDELDRLGAAGVQGRIVVFNPEWQGYGRTVQYRTQGASRAARHGAAAVLVRSMTGHSLRTPHTGAMNYQDGAAKIPAAAISVEDAAHIERLSREKAPVRLRLLMGARTLPDAEGANVIGEVRGSEKPDEVVVLGGHFDSWDVGQGAHDDGAACIACWHAVATMKRIGLRPRRTVRVVLWANEENGLRGGRAYREWAGSAVKQHVAAIEMDGGCERPVGYGLTITGASEAVMTRAMDRMSQIGKLLEPVGAGSMTRGGGGADIGPLMREGVPGIAHRTVGEHYMDWHHTHADTLDKIDVQDFRRSVAALGVLAFVLADMPDRLSE